jgi:RNA-binding protein 26
MFQNLKCDGSWWCSSTNFWRKVSFEYSLLNLHSPQICQECSGFIDTLFTVLRTKSYVPYVAAGDSPPLQVTPLDNPDGIPIPLDGLLTPSPDHQRPRKRSNPGNVGDERPHKGPRLNNDAGFSRYGDDGSRSAGGWMGMHGYTGPQIGGMNPFHVPPNGRQSQGYQPPDQKRGICRDYHSEFLFTLTIICS